MKQEHHLTLRTFEDADQTLFRRWLGEEHVRRWFGSPSDWLYETEKRRTEFNWIHHFIAEADGIPVGFGQFYEYGRSGETWHGDLHTDGVYSIDYLIGCPACLGKGYGTALIRALIGRVALQSNARCIIAQPEPDNTPSRHALRDAGFLFDEARRLFRIDV